MARTTTDLTNPPVIGEWHSHDKSRFPDGPWQTEPDKVHWIDPETGYDCLIHRGPLGALCGYVAVEPDHPFYGRQYDEVYSVDKEGNRTYLDVHGSLTYSDFCMETEDETTGVCHVPQPGRPEKVWWFGFDCGHWMDYIPGMNTEDLLKVYKDLEEKDPEHKAYRDEKALRETYKDINFVKAEVASLARQLKGLECQKSFARRIFTKIFR